MIENTFGTDPLSCVSFSFQTLAHGLTHCHNDSWVGKVLIEK